MPRPTKGPHLHLRKDRKPAVWYIHDDAKAGRVRISTGCGPRDRENAERQLAEYVARKYRPERERTRDPAEIKITDVLNHYLREVGPSVGRPKELAQRVTELINFFQRHTLADITADLCREYVAQRFAKPKTKKPKIQGRDHPQSPLDDERESERRPVESMARKELEDLRAAINYYHKSGLMTGLPMLITLPAKGVARERWLDRDEAARLIRAAWRYREMQKGFATGRRSRQHLARFILVALYTGTRSGAICGASLTRTIGRGEVDLKRGIFYRKALDAAETKKRQPTIDIPRRLLAHMRRWQRLGISKTAVIEWNGEPVQSVRKAFRRAVIDAGLDPTEVTPHVLRHTAVSWAMQNGVDIYMAADFFGMTVEMIQTVYGHLHPDNHQSVGDAISGKRRRS